MLIIIEGVDCSGKTTLAKKLIERIGEDNVSLLSKGPPSFDNPIVEYLWPLSGYVPGSNQHIICDRWHIGEMIYPKIFKRDSIMTIEEFKIIDDTIRTLGAFTAYLEPKIDELLTRFRIRGDKLITRENDFIASFIEFYTFMRTRYAKNNYMHITDFTAENIMDSVISWILKRAHECELESEVKFNARH